jgi:hypothetical protein
MLELGAGGGDLGLPCRRNGARPHQVLASPVQRVVSLHQRRPHPLDRGGASRSLGVLLRRQVHAGGRPSSFVACWPAVTSSLRAILVAVEHGHDSGSVMVMDCGGAMRIGEGARRAKQVLGKDEGASAAPGRKRKGRGREVRSVEVKIHLAPPQIYRSMEPRSPNRTLCVH